MTYRFSTLADYISMEKLRRYDMSHYLRSTTLTIRVLLLQSDSDHRLPALCAPSERLSVLRGLCSPGLGEDHLGVQWKRLCVCFSPHVGIFMLPVVTVCTFLVLPQVPALLLLCGAQPDQHRRSAGAHHDLWDFISDDKLLHWRLCLLQLDWTGRVRRLCKGLRSDLFVMEWATFLSIGQHFSLSDERCDRCSHGRRDVF